VDPGPADVAYQTGAQAGGFGQTLASFLKFLDLPPGATVLDVGTGPGLVLRLLHERGHRVVGSDALIDMLHQARALMPAGAPKPPSLVGADAGRLPFAGGSFDGVIATNLLFLLPDPAAALSELVRVLRAGGWLGMLNPSDRLSRADAAAFADARGLEGFARFSLVNYGRIAEEHHRLSGEQWAGQAQSAGLRDIEVEDRGGGLMTILKGRK
jgi:ubiquinone/menaquinone biosynthesis C-methylase UbiE